MSRSIAFLHVGDLHADEADGWLGVRRLERIVADLATHRIEADFLFLPGDNANHGTLEQYDLILAALAPLSMPWRTIPGDHDFEPGHLAAYEAAVPERNRPEAERVRGHRCVFLDIVSDGLGGPDFRLGLGERDRLRRELARAAAEGDVPLVFMHAYPADLAVDAAEVAQTLADGGVAYVGTGHTHYGELVNDDRVIYGAVRSTAQIEEDGGRPGLATVCVHEGVPSWRFRRLDEAWPAVQIVSPCDLRLVTRPTDVRQVPRPGRVEIVARLFGTTEQPIVHAPGSAAMPMAAGADGLWRATVELPDPGVHAIRVCAGHAEDVIELLVRPVEGVPKRRPPVALGHPAHAIGAWPAAGLLGTRLGPNRNGCDW